MNNTVRFVASVIAFATLNILMGILLTFNSKAYIEKQISEQLSEVLNTIDQYSVSYESIEQMLTHFENVWTASSTRVDHSATLFPVISSSTVDVATINYPAIQQASDIYLNLDDNVIGISLEYEHHYNLSGIVFYLFLFSCLLLGSAWVVRSPIQENDQSPNESKQDRLLECGARSEDMVRLLAFDNLKLLSELELKWFLWAFSRTDCLDYAWRVAKAEDSLELDAAKRHIYIRGLGIELSKTPFFYYYWYAKRKSQGLSAYTNPSVNKPDRIAGANLADIMIQFNGAAKTIDDLHGIGVRSKNLDLNRNKVKERLVSELGELSTTYLFESNRDSKTARYQYQLTLSSEHIHFRA
ncbi:hypothetical protein ITG09_19625 [Vibrio cyclitrophicus]|nr:hypothetical protein [Vibrio cyclitrophicus]UPR49509.1 hypothetical protein ITG13_21445 [Vibrio cyclitrophicus]UPR55134.1 hypothetical protein ITG09_19625 [Vibrio cyclitrophicus]